MSAVLIFALSLIVSAMAVGVPKNSISSHVLDISLGKPAEGVKVTTFLLEGEQWTNIGEHSTDSNGRIPWVMESTATKLKEGTYKLHFNTGEYYKQKGIETFYPFAEVVFTVKNVNQHYHVPLTLSPFGYSTYKGQ